MVEIQITIGLVVERWASASQWGSVTWRPSQVFAHPPEVAPWTRLGGTAATTRYYAGACTFTLYSTETANYRDNLASGSPQLWVVLRQLSDAPPIDIFALTADPAEGEAFTEPGIDVVEAVAMPGEIAALVAQFVSDHHVERVFEKRKRDKSQSKSYGPGGLHRGPPPAKT